LLSEPSLELSEDEIKVEGKEVSKRFYSRDLFHEVATEHSGGCRSFIGFSLNIIGV
jgi:hypothetical protein